MVTRVIFIRWTVLILTLCAPAFTLAQTLRLKATLRGHTKSIDRIAFSPDGKQIATIQASVLLRDSVRLISGC